MPTVEVNPTLVADGLEMGVVDAVAKLDRFNRSNVLDVRTATAPRPLRLRPL